jgi:predicted RNA-binding protein
MCQTAAYLVREGKEVLLLEDVVSVTPEGPTLKMVNLFGEEKVVEGKIRQIDLLTHRITIHAG